MVLFYPFLILFMVKLQPRSTKQLYSQSQAIQPELANEPVSRFENEEDMSFCRCMKCGEEGEVRSAGHRGCPITVELHVVTSAEDPSLTAGLLEMQPDFG